VVTGIALGPATGRARSRKAVLGALKRYRIMADIVGVGLIVLCVIGIPLQYGAGNKAVVAIIGPIHGFAYIVYLAAAYDLARRGRWTLWQLASVILAGFVPGLAFVAEHYTSKRVHAELDEREGTEKERTESERTESERTESERTKSERTESERTESQRTQSEDPEHSEAKGAQAPD
jgi:integral membrane protein